MGKEGHHSQDLERVLKIMGDGLRNMKEINASTAEQPKMREEKLKKVAGPGGLPEEGTTGCAGLTR